MKKIFLIFAILCSVAFATDKIVTQDPTQPGISKVNGPIVVNGIISNANSLAVSSLVTNGAAIGYGVIYTTNNIPQWFPLPFISSFTSTQLVLTSGATIEVDHGFGTKPSLSSLVLININPELGYSLSEEVSVNPSVSNPSTAQGFGLAVGNDHYHLRYGTNASIIPLIRRDNGTVANITNSSWRAIIRAWK